MQAGLAVGGGFHFSLTVPLLVPFELRLFAWAVVIALVLYGPPHSEAARELLVAVPALSTIVAAAFYAAERLANWWSW